MSSFLRILDNSGLGHFERLIENMTREQAAKVMEFHGITGAATLSGESIQAATRSIIREYAETLVDEEAIREVRAACAVLSGPLEEAVLLEFSARTPTTVIYYHDDESGKWFPHGVLGQRDSIDNYCTARWGTTLAPEQHAALESGQPVEIRKKKNDHYSRSIVVAVRNFEAILPTDLDF